MIMRLSPKRMLVVVALVLVEYGLFFAAFSGSHLDKAGSGSAWFEWRAHPSAQTEAAWLAEKRQIRTEQIILEATIWSMIVASGAGIYYAAKRQM